jgi:hypothetical protein
MSAKGIDAIVSTDGLRVNGHVFDTKLPIDCYRKVFGIPSRTIAPGAPAPVDHRNNHVHIFDLLGIYLTEHHATRLIESVNFIFSPLESPFPIENPFIGNLRVGPQRFRVDMREKDLDSTLFSHDLAGEKSVRFNNYWVGISAKGRRGTNGKRKNPRYVVRVSVGF